MCAPSQTTLHLKEQVAMCLPDMVSEASTLQIETKDGTIMSDEESLESLKNDEELYVCLPISDGEWEPVDIVSTAMVG